MHPSAPVSVVGDILDHDDTDFDAPPNLYQMWVGAKSSQSLARIRKQTYVVLTEAGAHFCHCIPWCDELERGFLAQEAMLKSMLDQEPPQGWVVVE